MIDRFLELADVVMIGGAMCFPFLRAQGHAVGESLCDDEDVEHARRALAKAPSGTRERAAAAERPGDRRPRSTADAEHRVLDGVEVPDGWMGLDIGPGDAPSATPRRSRAPGTVFWNGPMGAFELEPFAAGTRRGGRGGRRGARA